MWYRLPCLTRTVAIGFLLFTTTTVARCQHYNWKVSLTNGMEIESVHSDSDSLPVSTSNFDVYWFRLDNIRTITYDYNPTTVTPTLQPQR